MDKKTEKIIDDAMDALEQERPEDALALAKKALKLAPRQRDALLVKADALDALERLDAALEVYGELTELYPEDAEVWLRAGLFAEHSAADPETAVDAYTTAVELAGGDDEGESADEEMLFEALMALGAARVTVRDLEGAHEVALRAHKLAPEDPDPDVLTGEVLFEMGRFEDAGKAASRALDKAPRHAGAFQLRGLVLERMEDADGAQKAFAKARALEPEVFPEPVTLDDAALLAAACEAIRTLDEEQQAYLADMRLVVEEFPTANDVESAGFEISPLCEVTFRGGDEDHQRPREVVFYRRNVGRMGVAGEDLVAFLAAVIADELEQFQALDGDLDEG